MWMGRVFFANYAWTGHILSWLYDGSEANFQRTFLIWLRGFHILSGLECHDDIGINSHLKWQQQNLACFHVCMLAVVIIDCFTIFTSAWAFGPSFYQFDGLRKRLQQRCHQDLCQWLQQTFQYPSPLSLTAHSLEYTCERVSGFPSSFHSNCVCCGSMKRNQLRQVA